MRGEDKEEGRGLGEGPHFFCFRKFYKRWKRRRKMGRKDCFGNSHRALLLLGNLGLGAGNRKDSWSSRAREVFASWLGG
jgi:hypothetical protein